MILIKVIDIIKTYYLFNMAFIIFFYTLSTTTKCCAALIFGYLGLLLLNGNVESPDVWVSSLVGGLLQNNPHGVYSRKFLSWVI